MSNSVFLEGFELQFVTLCASDSLYAFALKMYLRWRNGFWSHRLRFFYSPSFDLLLCSTDPTAESKTTTEWHQGAKLT